MLFPKKTKFRKMYRRDSYKKEYRVNNLSLGEFGMKSLQSGRVTAKQLESARKTMVKKDEAGWADFITNLSRCSYNKQASRSSYGKG